MQVANCVALSSAGTLTAITRALCTNLRYVFLLFDQLCDPEVVKPFQLALEARIKMWILSN